MVYFKCKSVAYRNYTDKRIFQRENGVLIVEDPKLIAELSKNKYFARCYENGKEITKAKKKGPVGYKKFNPATYNK